MRLSRHAQKLENTRRVITNLPWRFGPTKNQELIRLIYEIAKRDNSPPDSIVDQLSTYTHIPHAKAAFEMLKDTLVRLRYPESYISLMPDQLYLPKIEINDQNLVKVSTRRSFYPKYIYVEEAASGYPLVKNIRKRFTKSEVHHIRSLKHFFKNYPKHTVGFYNSRRNFLFLAKERHDFLKSCPCSSKTHGCGYMILNIGFGCPYECSYCFLQGYTNTPGIMLPVNIDDYLAALTRVLKHTKRVLRIGTGEFTDSLALDELTGYARILIEFFARQEHAILELKTKSSSIDSLLSLNHNGHTVIGWSVNPQSIVTSDEQCAVSLHDRLHAAARCVKAGYKVGFHFDPIIYSKNWQKEYKQVVKEIFSAVSAKDIAWISLGTFRFPPALKPVIEQRFPGSKILDEELILGFDRKLRYPRQRRSAIYKAMLQWLREHGVDRRVYLCMESVEMWQAVLGRKSLPQC